MNVCINYKRGNKTAITSYNLQEKCNLQKKKKNYIFYILKLLIFIVI